MVFDSTMSQTNIIRSCQKKRPRSTATTKEVKNAVVKKKKRAAVTQKYNAKYATKKEKENAMRRAKEFQEELHSGNPSFLKTMLVSHAARTYWLGLPKEFCMDNHLPLKGDNPRENYNPITLVDEKGYKITTHYIAERTGLSAGWVSFAIEHKLDVGDALVFELLDPRTFKVYIFSAGATCVSEESAGMEIVQLKPRKVTKRSTREKIVKAHESRESEDSVMEDLPSEKTVSELEQLKPWKKAIRCTKERILKVHERRESEDSVTEDLPSEKTANELEQLKPQKVAKRITKKSKEIAETGSVFKTYSLAENCESIPAGLVRQISKTTGKLFRRKAFPESRF